jgi:hypothetical protein
VRRLVLLAAGLGTACQGPVAALTSSSTTASDETTAGTTTSSTSGASTHPTSGSMSTSASTSTSADTTVEPTTADPSTTDANTTGDPSTTTGDTPKSCKKLDILFLIIDRGELWSTATGLKNLMPHLAGRLESDFADWDYHLMVIKGDDTWGNLYCDETCAMGDPCVTEPPYPCEYEPTTCDLTLGAGITFPAGGAYAANVPCPIDGDRRYITSGQHDLAGTLECLRQVGGGYDGSKLFPVVRSTLDALDAPLNAPGACNEGFLRDDAYLILFLVSPFPDFISEGTPADWTFELKAHKGGKFDRIYFVGLFQGCESSFGWKEFEPLNEWVESLYHHQLDDACASKLIPYMDPALDYVLGECAE